MNYARERPPLLKYLPEERDWTHIDKQWLCDILFSVDTEGIEKMIKEAMKKRQNVLEATRNEVIEIRPEFS